MIRYTLCRFEQELQKRLTEIRKQAAVSTHLAVLQKHREDLQAQAERLA